MTKVIAIGAYSETDLNDLKARHDALVIDNIGKLPAIPEDTRQQVEAVAYKGGRPFGGAEMDLTPNLRLIANFGVGYDAISIPDATARGITVTNTPDVLNDDVADLAVAMLIARARDMPKAENFLRDGKWAYGETLPLARKMSGRRVGIAGLGRIGREIADRLAAFKCDIHYTSRQEKDTPGWTYHDSVVALAEAVDDLVIAVVGGPDTVNYVDAKAVAALGPDGLIVNISRGSVIDEDALLQALEQGVIRGAALDVFLNEPDIDRRFLALDNVLLLPHVGSATVETRAAMGALQRANIDAVLGGDKPLTPVNAH